MIAQKIGYTDVQSYSKYFKKQFGISPALFSNKKEKLFKKEIKANTIMLFFEDRIIQLKPKKVIYKTVKWYYYSNKIDEVWEQLLQETAGLNINSIKTESFGIIKDEPLISEHVTYNYDACLVIDNVSQIPAKKFKVKEISSQKHAVFTHVGDYQSISKTYNKSFQ